MTKICPLLLAGCNSSSASYPPDHWQSMMSCHGDKCAWYTGEGCAVVAIAKNRAKPEIIFADINSEVRDESDF